MSKLWEGLNTAVSLSDPVEWQEKMLGVELYSNQIEISECLFDPHGTGFNILGCRGSGKTQGLAWAIIALCAMRPKTTVICAAPIEKQAARILRYMKSALLADVCKVKHLIDWPAVSALKLPFKNGSVVVAVSGQEKASSEGEHGQVLVIDEAHLVPSYSVTNKLTPMIMSTDGYSKIIKIGVSMGRGHFYKSVQAQNSVNCICPWQKAEIYLAEPNPLIYKGRQFSRLLLSRMPVPLKVKMFPDRPDLHVGSGLEVSENDWATQYAMEWIDDIHNLLSDEDQKRLASGTHNLLTRGFPGERYFAGLDTAQGSLTGHSDTDRTVLSIWRLRKDGILEKVAAYVWVGRILEQEAEIWEIANPKDGLFKCELVFGDYSNIAISIIERFRKAGCPIVGVTFGSSAKKVGSPKNWKNVLYDHFMVQLQSGLLKMPDVDKLRLARVDAPEDMKVQIDNVLESFDEWCVIQSERGRGINNDIHAPTDKVEDEDGVSVVAHDDACSADVLAVYAARYPEQLKKDMMSGTLLSSYAIPTPVISHASYAGQTSLLASQPQANIRGENPIAMSQRRTPAQTKHGSSESSSSYITQFLNTPGKKK